MINKTEILAPAGSPDALKAAVLCGADAVYLGVRELNARRGAENFDYTQLSEAVEFCHSRKVKVYLTLNTVISDGEIKTASKIIERACASGIDALILQDFAAVVIINLAVSLVVAFFLVLQTKNCIKQLVHCCGF
mgnify:CR=1 FL=1